MKYLFASLLLFSFSAHADDWTTPDTYREIIFQSILIVDWGQTRNISMNPIQSSTTTTSPSGTVTTITTQVNEINPLLGAHPPLGKVNRYFVIASMLHAGIAYFLPSKYRAPFQYITIGVETGYVSHNFSIGIHTKF